MFMFRSLRRFTTSTTEWTHAKLCKRSLIRVRGADTLHFLQGLVTNDTTFLASAHSGGGEAEKKNKTSMYAMMLNTQGRLLYDLILYAKNDEEIYLECDRSACTDLVKTLTLYRLRRKLEFHPCEKELFVYALWSKGAGNADTDLKLHGEGEPFFLCPDPRLTHLGFRAILKEDDEAKHIFGSEVCGEDEYDAHRYTFGVGEGCGEMPPGASFPLEVNGDYLNGISFHKGCYVGQELTARVHHTGVVRKRLMPLKFADNSVTSDLKINAKVLDENGANVGKFRRAVRNVGLALLYVTEALAAQKLFVQTDDGQKIECTTERPFWWDGNVTVDGGVRGFHPTETASRAA